MGGVLKGGGISDESKAFKRVKKVLLQEVCEWQNFYLVSQGEENA